VTIRASVRVALAAAAAFALFEGPSAAAGFAAKDIVADSELVLHERVDWGTYREYTVRMRIRGQSVILVTNKDGVRRTARVPLASALRLWSGLQGYGLARLTDVAPARLFPDQSSFRVVYRVRGEHGGFSVYGVDSLPDRRYRSVVRDILDLAESHTRPGRPGVR